jgi:hypothetical protein
VNGKFDGNPVAQNWEESSVAAGRRAVEAVFDADEHEHEDGKGRKVAGSRAASGSLSCLGESGGYLADVAEEVEEVVGTCVYYY